MSDVAFYCSLMFLSWLDIDSDSEASDSELSDSPSLDSDIEQEQEKSYERLTLANDACCIH